MANNNRPVGDGQRDPLGANAPEPAPIFRLTFVENPFVLVSLLRQILEQRRERKIRATANYPSRDAKRLPTEMPPWYRALPSQIREFFQKPKPSLVPLASHPIDVPNIWQDYQQEAGSWLNSLLVHALVVTALIIPFISAQSRTVRVKTRSDTGPVFFPYFRDTPKIAFRADSGGGGGVRSPLPASQGALAKFAREQLAPPMVNPLEATFKLLVTPTLIGPPQLQLPEMQAKMPWGDPNGVPDTRSGGPGDGGGIGNGKHGGIGSGEGPGWGPGKGGGVSVETVGGNVTAPTQIFSPAPDYSEEARRAKFQGVVMLSLVVDAQGNPTDIHVVKSLGMGLDEKAMEKVRTWKFIPGHRNDVPVPVRVMLEITFRLF